MGGVIRNPDTGRLVRIGNTATYRRICAKYPGRFPDIGKYTTKRKREYARYIKKNPSKRKRTKKSKKRTRTTHKKRRTRR